MCRGSNMGMREFDDVVTMRTNILNNVKNSVIAKYPIENDRYRLEVGEVDYDTIEPSTLAQQKKLLMRNSSLNRKLYGTWKLIDKVTGDIIDEKRAVVAHVPDVTHRGTFIRNGSEYTVANQMRLKPGVYTRRKESGDLEAHFNVMPGTGRPFRVHMEPATGVFKMQIGQSHIPLYPLLRSQGVTDAQLQKQWGVDLLNVNRQKTDPQALTKAYDRLVGKKEEGETPEAGLMREFSNMKFDPDIVQNNIGNWFDKQEDTPSTPSVPGGLDEVIDLGDLQNGSTTTQ